MIQDWQYLQDPGTMEQISSKELGAHLDEYLERCDKENIGFVVTHNEKKYVLCPARWMDCEFDDDFGCVVNSALRYAINRNTYMPKVVARYISRHLVQLDDKTLSVICKDIEEKLDTSGAGEPELWQQLLADCKKALEERKKQEL